MNVIDQSELPPNPSPHAAGIALTMASVLMVVLMAFHPRAHVHRPDHFVEAFAAIATVNALVHGSLVALLLVMFYGLSVFAKRLECRHPWALFGTILFAFGVMALASAAVLSGLVVPAFVAQYADGSAADIEIVRHLVRLVYAIVISATRVGVVAVSSAVLVWALALLGYRNGMAAIGLVAGGLLLVALASGHLAMDVHGMMFFALAQAAWSITVGVALIRGKI